MSETVQEQYVGVNVVISNQDTL